MTDVLFSVELPIGITIKTISAIKNIIDKISFNLFINTVKYSK